MSLTGKIWLLALLLLIFLSFPIRPHAATCPDNAVCLSWTPPATNEDGTALAATDLGSYVIYLNGKAVAYPGPTNTVYTYALATGVCVLPTDQWTMTASKTNGKVSVLSTPASVAVKKCGPVPVLAPVAPKVTAQ